MYPNREFDYYYCSYTNSYLEKFELEVLLANFYYQDYYLLRLLQYIYLLSKRHSNLILWMYLATGLRFFDNQI